MDMGTWLFLFERRKNVLFFIVFILFAQVCFHFHLVASTGLGVQILGMFLYIV